MRSRYSPGKFHWSCSTTAISEFIRNEIVRVLTVKFAHDFSEVVAQLDEILVNALWVDLTGEVTGVCRDSGDDAILETAFKAEAGYLVAGDKDLLSLRQFRETAIISPAEYIALK